MKGLYIKEITILDELFRHSSIFKGKYKWCISYYECTCYTCNAPFGKDILFFPGEQIEEVVRGNRQWIWGGFSAFPQDLSKEEILKYPLPDPWKEDGCFVLQKDFHMTHPLAEIEIDVWDGSYTTIIVKDEELYRKLKEEIKGSVDLAEYNQRL